MSKNKTIIIITLFSVNFLACDRSIKDDKQNPEVSTPVENTNSTQAQTETVQLLNEQELKLFSSIEFDQLDEVENILKLGQNPNIINEKGMTPLMLASQKGKKSIVQLLVKYGADIALTDKEGHDAIWWAKEYQKDAVVSYLQKQSEKKEVANQTDSQPAKTEGITPEPNDASNVSNVSTDTGTANSTQVSLTEEEQLSLNKEFLNAVSEGKKADVLYLLEEGSQIDFKLYVKNSQNEAEKGTTALMIASAKGYAEIVKILLDKGADVQLLSEGGNRAGATALILAAKSGNVEIIKLLMEKKPNTTIKWGNKTAFGWAGNDKKDFREEILTIFRQYGVNE